MSIDFDKIRNLLERVTAGGAGKVVASFNFKGKSCAITWERPRGVSGHESYKSRAEMLVYVKDLLMDAGVGVTIRIEVAQEDFLPED